MDNVRLRYNPREGKDLHLVYNTGLNADWYVVDSFLPLTSAQTLILKYTHTFAL